jgi:hypothetical protein
MVTAPWALMLMGVLVLNLIRKSVTLGFKIKYNVAFKI